MNNFLRHDLVWIGRENIPTEIPDWKFNFVVTGQRAVMQNDSLQIACCLNSGKSALSRKSFIVPRKLIIRHERPILFRNILAENNLLHLGKIIDEFDTLGVTLRIFGSYSWQHLTGNKYVTPKSDFDLLICLPESARLTLTESNCEFNLLPQIHQLILRLEAACPCPLDGEMVFLNGNFVSWREWFNPEPTILVKTTNTVSLCNKSELS